MAFCLALQARRTAKRLRSSTGLPWWWMTRGSAGGAWCSRCAGVGFTQGQGDTQRAGSAQRRFRVAFAPGAARARNPPLCLVCLRRLCLLRVLAPLLVYVPLAFQARLAFRFQPMPQMRIRRPLAPSATPPPLHNSHLSTRGYPTGPLTPSTPIPSPITASGAALKPRLPALVGHARPHGHQVHTSLHLRGGPRHGRAAVAECGQHGDVWWVPTILVTVV